MQKPEGHGFISDEDMNFLKDLMLLVTLWPWSDSLSNRDEY
jgi:hypothetical protein